MNETEQTAKFKRAWDEEASKLSAPRVRNTSGLEPLGVAVLVEPYEPEVRKSTIVLPETARERATMVECRAIVIAVGPFAWHDEPPRAKPGDKVYITRFAGNMVVGPKDGKNYRLINDRDLFCKILDEE